MKRCYYEGRENSKFLLELSELDIIDPYILIEDLLSYMPESQVADMVKLNGYDLLKKDI